MELEKMHYDSENDEYFDLDGHDEEHRYKIVKCDERYLVSDSGEVYGPKGVPLKPWKNKHGHEYVGIGKKSKLVHRLMAEAFIPNYSDGNIVRHLNDISDDNQIENLAWGTVEDNVHDCIENGHFRYFSHSDILKATEARKHPVVCTNLKDGSIYEFDSIAEASANLGVNGGRIQSAAAGPNRAVNGFNVQYKDCYTPIDISNYKYSRHRADIIATNVINGEVRKLKGQTETASALGMSVSAVCMVLSGKMDSAKSWTFKYAEE